MRSRMPGLVVNDESPIANVSSILAALMAFIALVTN